jgi:5-methylcytosine-specific restriction endonuclease McrA
VWLVARWAAVRTSRRQRSEAQQSQKGVTPRKDEAAVDHMDPRATGGSGDPINGQGLCRVCNGEKSDGPPPWGVP